MTVCMHARVCVYTFYIPDLQILITEYVAHLTFSSSLKFPFNLKHPLSLSLSLPNSLPVYPTLYNLLHSLTFIS